MAMEIKRVDVWAASIKDTPGGLADKLAPLTEAGASLEFVIARRAPEKRGQGVVFLTPLKGPKQLRAAKAAGFAKTTSLHSLRIAGADKRGIGSKITQAIADAGLNLRGLSAAAIGRKFVCHLAFDSSPDAASAKRALKKL